MRAILFVLPIALLGLSGCVDVESHPTPRSTTVVTPAPAAPPVMYAAPGTSTSTTVVTRP